jgi:hypothetical protein
MSQLSGLGRSDYAEDEQKYVADRRLTSIRQCAVAFIAYFAVPQSLGRRVAIHYSFIRSAATFLAWEDALNDCLGLLGESVSGARSSREHPAPREEQNRRVVEFARQRA